jgi:Undecaprenyl-phosphate glucose phosphotransferase
MVYSYCLFESSLQLELRLSLTLQTISTRTASLAPWLRVSYQLVRPIFSVCDALIVLAASMIGGAGYHILISDGFGEVGIFLAVGIVASIAYVFAAWHLDIYNFPSLLHTRTDYGRILTVWSFVLLVLALLFFLVKIGNQVSRGFVICFVVLAVILLIGWRSIAKRLLRAAFARGAVQGRRVMLVGTQNELASLNPDHLIFDYGLDEIDRVTLPNYDSAKLNLSQHEISAINTVIERARRSEAEEIVLVMPWARSSYFNVVSERLGTLPLPVRLLPDRFIRSIWKHATGRFRRPLSIEVQRAPLTRAEQWTKRLFDIAVSAVILILLVPVLLVVCIGVKLDTRGPAIFRQGRKGFNGKEFTIYKFRTMTTMENGPKILQACAHDARVTRVGRLLRRSSIDELPQLINVLRGEMSLVGPRPHAVAHDEEYGSLIPTYAFRHHVKPGITGWAQVHGFRGETRNLGLMKKRIELDLWYINNWSVALDAQILAWTFFEIFRGRNAH